MSTNVNETLFERAGELLPYLNVNQASELNELFDDNDLDGLEFYINYLEAKYAKQQRIKRTSKPVKR